ncbi:MAG: LPS translocon maturation chaperone LptM [Pseudomonadota bacterium]
MRVLILVLLALMLVLAGCGQKGPLYREAGEGASGDARVPTTPTTPRHLC